jgi:antitoxin component YwqK of YwqJK toxin-antitoxin module
MEITFKDLADKYRWEEIEPVLSLLYPAPKKSIAEYKEAYHKFSATIPIKTRMRIVIESKKEPNSEKWHEVYGKNGTLVKEAFQSEYAYKHLKDTWESEQGYALSYTNWEEIAGMTVDSNTLSSYPEKDIVVHVLMLITEHWRSDEQNLKVLKELEAIAEKREQNVTQKEMLGKNGFRQTWSEKENGEFHGLYTVYWENGNIIEQQGIIVDGNKEGVWTYWDKGGKIEKQIRCWCDREIEVKLESPWWDNVHEQI